MKRFFILAAVAALALFAASCSGRKDPSVPEYTVINAPQEDILLYPMDEEGFYHIFDGSSLEGWRGYGMSVVPLNWSIEDGYLLCRGSGTGEAHSDDGGDLIFACAFKNFILELDWLVSEGGNSGIFYLAREVTTKGEDGLDHYVPIFITAPEYQVLDNANHPDASLGVNGNRQSASLYDMIPADPQNQNPYGQWNKATIVVDNGKVEHYQNGEKVLEYRLWNRKWTNMLQASKFSQEAWPLAFELLNDCGGKAHEGYIGLQDHGDDVWYKDIKVKILD